MPEEGFFVNKIIKKVIIKKYKSERIRKLLIESYKNLNDTIYEYESLDPETYIFDYVRDIINKIDLHREELSNEIDKRISEMIKQLEEKEQKCKSNPTKSEKLNFDRLKLDLISWEHSLRVSY